MVRCVSTVTTILLLRLLAPSPARSEEGDLRAGIARGEGVTVVVLEAPDCRVAIAAVTDPEGRFDASNAGDVEGLHWVVGMETISVDQLKSRDDEPGLLAKHLGRKKEPLREVAAFTALSSADQVEAIKEIARSSRC